ncbi:DUF6752 domain-containing protein [Leifsonia sp. Leaf264]|uniref:DUF6752 domain-containing protein n=1 Tax=Leifsonia sp. Leaf264 TaxID=1736314 RepID=UPI0006F869B4|nr:DUF6752 domain-containing protein [Leifsonia sp. Leaf264]KQO99443.1 hypothetical protein ASF30_05755 [Leifsonia sp. Leaf264]
MKDRIKKRMIRTGWKMSPDTMAAMEEVHAFREEVAALRKTVASLKREIDESRRDSLRIAELTDVVVEKLAAFERASQASRDSDVPAV